MNLRLKNKGEDIDFVFLALEIDNPRMKTKIEEFNENEIERAFEQSGFRNSKSHIVKPYRAEDAMRYSPVVREIGVLAISVRTKHPELNTESSEEYRILSEMMEIDKSTREKLFDDLTGFGDKFNQGPLRLSRRTDIEAMASKRQKVHDDPEKYVVDIYRDAYGI